MFKRMMLAAVAAMAPFAAHSAIVVDGTIDAGEYAGAIATSSIYDATANDLSFGTIYDRRNHLTGYDTFFKVVGDRVYVAFQSRPAGAGNDEHDASLGIVFANLYFNTDVIGGSDLGFEVFNDRAFRPGVAGYSSSITALGASFARTIGTTYANGGKASVMEFSAPTSFFTTNVFGFGQALTPVGGPLQLRTVQAFGYTPNGGAFTPPNGVAADARFGSLNIPAAVPEPGTWAMMLLGFGLVGGVMRMRRSADSRRVLTA